MQSQMNSHQAPGRPRSPYTSLPRILLGFVCLLAFAAMSFGQGISGRLQGTVQDGTGAVISGANIRVTNQDTGVVNKYTSDNRGAYIANLLPPGNYKVEISASGFRTTVSTGNVVTVD